MELLQGREVYSLLSGDVTFQTEWDALFRDCPWATVIQSRVFVATWFEVYQSKFRPLLLITVEEGRLSGLLALAMPRSGSGLQGGRLVGAGQYDAEYQTWLARPQNGDDFMPLALEKLCSVLPGHHLQLRFLPPGFVHFLLLGQQLCRQEVAMFDLTPGQDAYKERLATGHDQVQELMVSANLGDFLRKNMRKNFHGLLLKMGIRPMTFNLHLHKGLYLLRNHLLAARRQGLWRTVIYHGRQFLYSGKIRLYVFMERQVPPQETVLAEENNLSDLLDFDHRQPRPSRWEFLEKALHRYSLGEKSYSWSEQGCLLACAWVRQPGTGRAENLIPAMGKEAVLLEGIYCHPSFHNQFRSFLIALAGRLSCSMGSSSLYACISASDQALGKALTAAGFRPFQEGVQAYDNHDAKC